MGGTPKQDRQKLSVRALSPATLDHLPDRVIGPVQAHRVHDQALAFGLQVECISVRDHSRAIGEIRQEEYGDS